MSCRRVGNLNRGVTLTALSSKFLHSIMILCKASSTSDTYASSLVTMGGSIGTAVVSVGSFAVSTWTTSFHEQVE